MQVSINRQLGGIFMVLGTEIGAGILALPILVSKLGFLTGLLLMLLTWFFMTYTSLLITEALLTAEDGTSYAKLARKFLGVSGEVVSWFSFLLLLYMIIVAYISAAGSTFNTILNIGNGLTSTIFVIFFAFFVIRGFGTVDWINRFLLITKLGLLLFVCILLISKVHIENLNILDFNNKGILMTLPVFITTFVAHPILPALRTYLKSDIKAITRVILIGSLLALFFYIFWILIILGVIPLSGENSILVLNAKGMNANVGDVLNLLKLNVNNDLFYTPISIFSNISVMTSFLGTSLALYHFMIDSFRLNRFGQIKKNTIATLFTFIIPLFIVVFCPNIFIKALSYVGLCCVVLFLFIPFLITMKLKKRRYVFKLRYINNKLLLYVSLLIGITVILIQTYNLYLQMGF